MNHKNLFYLIHRSFQASHPLKNSRSFWSPLQVQNARWTTPSHSYTIVLLFIPVTNIFPKGIKVLVKYSFTNKRDSRWRSTAELYRLIDTIEKWLTLWFCGCEIKPVFFVFFNRILYVVRVHKRVPNVFIFHSFRHNNTSRYKQIVL